MTFSWRGAVPAGYAFVASPGRALQGGGQTSELVSLTEPTGLIGS